MAISSWGRGSRTWRIGEEGSCWSSWSPWAMPPPRRWILGCRMTRWRRSTGEGSIYRTKWEGANLTYLFAASVKSEGVQVDMVTICTIIKELCRCLDSKRSWFWKYFTVQDRLVGPSAVLSNGNVADERIKWRDLIEVERFEESAKESGRGCLDLAIDYQVGGNNCEKASLLQRISEH